MDKYPETDNYSTPPEALQLICKYIPKEAVIWDPFYCDGLMRKQLVAIGHDDEKIIHEQVDFFTLDEFPNYDVLISSPPFSKMRWILPYIAATNKRFALLTNLNSIASNYFRSAMRGKEIQIICPQRPVRFIKNGTQLKTGCTLATVWVTFGLDIPRSKCLTGYI
jgi:hypothetical protein